jgi:N-acetylmuramoyl-L-alanine amidase
VDGRALNRIGLAVIVAALAFAGDLAAPGRCRATTLRDAWVERRGDLFTIHLRISGRPRWVVSAQANRLVIDLPGTKSNLPSRQFLEARIGALGKVRISDASGERLRMEIDATRKCDYVVGRQRGQLIVRLGPSGTGHDLAQVFAPPPVRTRHPRRARKVAPAPPAAPIAPAPRTTQNARAPRAAENTAPSIAPAPVRHQDATPPETALAEQSGKEPVVVVDAGHGGHDPGTHSEDGLLEKDLVLQIAQRLAQALRQRGVNAVLTRDRDVFLSLAQRTAIANQLAADLFVSIHLNWSPNAATTGIEVYYLNNTTDRATIRLARMENAADGGHAPLSASLNYILSDLRQQYKATESALLARGMEQQTVSELQAGFGGEIRGLGAKKGPFYVLVGPRIPAVLVECGFLSNVGEARRLALPAYQQTLANGLATAVVRYLNQEVSAGTL